MIIFRLAEDFSSEGGERCIALYSYSGEAESSMGLQVFFSLLDLNILGSLIFEDVNPLTCFFFQEGEEVTVTEGDLGGWTRVRRGGSGEEGYVPTAYLQWLT